LSDSPTQEALACPRCGARLEAAAKVYFDLTAAERLANGELAVTGIEVAELNDSFDGHPAAIESELVVSCVDCGEGVDFRLAGAAPARTVFYRGLPGDSKLLLRVAREIYHGARDGQAAVEAWARGPQVAPHVSYRRCEPCEAATPHIGDICALCERAIGVAPLGGLSVSTAAAAALRVDAKAREAMAEIYEEADDAEAVESELDRARYLRELAEEVSAEPVISLVYSEADVRDYAEEAGVSEDLALRRTREWGRHIQDTAAGLCAEQLLSVVRSGQP
jgi:hypothetical protein